MKTAMKVWTTVASVLLCVQVVTASASPNIDFCDGCCTAVSVVLGFTRATRDCCFRGCRGLSRGSNCDGNVRNAMYEGGTVLIVDRRGRFRFVDVNYLCFEDSPGNYEARLETAEPTSSPVRAPADPDISQVVAASSVVGSAAVLCVLGLVLMRRRRKNLSDDVEGFHGNGNLQLSALARHKKKSSLHSLHASQVSQGSARSKNRSKKGSIYASQGGESDVESEGTEQGSVRIVSLVDAEKSIRSGILSYRKGNTDSFDSVSVSHFQKSVTHREESKFSQFKRLSTATSVKRKSVYFTESALLNTRFIVKKVITEKNKVLSRSRDADGFSGYAEPDISLSDYLIHLIEHLDEWYNSSFDSSSMRKPAGVNALFIAMIYQKRLKSKIPSFVLTSYNVHRVFAVSMLIGAKFSEDDIITNKYWGVVARIHQSELNKIESSFCSALNFDLYVSPEEFKACSEPYLPPNLKTQDKKRLYRYSI